MAVTIGASIMLIVVGAILKFATNLQVDHVNLHVVGVILMVAGIAGLILGFVQQRMSSRSARVREYRDPGDPRPPTY
ncbi:MAG: hypothetical protein JSU06_17330 [Actinobacteria bacterium]|nr:hypothetical protein [Actinomycetota bacterium]